MTQGKNIGPIQATDAMVDDTQVVAVSIDFGTMGNSAEYKLAGWQEPEAGFTWTLGNSSSLMFLCPERLGRYALELYVTPFLWKDRLTAQRMCVSINDEEVGKFTIDHEQVVRCEVSWSALTRRSTCIVEFELPDAAEPAHVNGVADRRSIAFAFRRVQLICLDNPTLADGEAGPRDDSSADGVLSCKSGRYPALPPTGKALTELMMSFESLGEDCEFGLVQRRCGAEPLGLLRFASSPLPKLIAAMEARFEGLGQPEQLSVELAPSGREYMVLDKCFGLYYHAWVLAGEKSPEEVHARERKRLPFLINKLIEDLELGEKIFVYRGMKLLAESDMMKLSAIMRRFGSTTLLWVERADDEHEAGSVEELAPGLWRGNIERFAPATNAHDFDLNAWVKICHNALGLKSTMRSFSL